LAQAKSRISAVDLKAISSLVEHTPEDMTATVETGLSLAAFQEQLRAHGQWLPIDPPRTAELAIADLLAFNLSGPRRCGYGTIRDYLIGIKVAMAGGQIVKAGGKVVKNVAGYDLCKLFVGAQHSLGIIIEATFKLRPLPEREVLVQAGFGSLQTLDETARALLASPVEPVILDAHNLDGPLALVAGFAGSAEEVEYQLSIAREHGLAAICTDRYHENFDRAGKLSVLPSRTIQTLTQRNPPKFLAHLGNGIIFGAGLCQPPPLPHLSARMKSAYDPRGILPEYPA
jgi:FAD/FMN-containing dehydrogenase